MGCVGGGLGTSLGLVDEGVADVEEDEDVADDDVADDDVADDDCARSQGDAPWWPQPVVAAATTRVTAAQPTTVTRANSMGIPFHVNLGRSAYIQQFDRGA
jgi:hypothetical protein